ncbi:endonuclease domain-containing protein [Demequina oxidasica]|uniref:endonuclease domain-containing protein n=1 Tax=Demequina oxidasica TaxID=676199 RepID=UPI000782E996|nr:DUF559 domain-containing protein [Demequina oxidasica]
MALPLRLYAPTTVSEYLDRVRAPCRRADLEIEWSKYRVSAALHSGDAVDLLPGLIVARAHVQNPTVRAQAISAWCPRAVVTGQLALHLERSELAAPEIADIVIERPYTVRAPDWIRVRSVAELPSSRVRNLVRLATPAHALVDAWRAAQPRDRRSTFYEAMWQRSCSVTQLYEALEWAPRVPARRTLLHLVAHFAWGATSPLEVLARNEAFTGADFAKLEWQAEITTGGRRRVADALHREARVLIELDGEAFHGSAKARREDRERDVEFAAAGYLTLRFGWRDLHDRPSWCRDRVRRVLKTRLDGTR